MDTEPLAFPSPDRHAQGRRRGDAAAHPGAARRGRADGLRPHRDPAPVAAAASRAISSSWPRPGWSSASARAPGRSSGWASAAARPTSRASLIARLDPDDPVIARDRERLAAVRAARAAAAQDYFRRHAAEWDRIRKLHVADDGGRGGDPRARSPTSRSARCSISAPAPAACSNCSRREIERGLGIDLSLDMLALARARLDRAGLRHCSVRQGDIYDLALPRDSFDVVIIHQVLHFLDDGARAIREAARRAAPGRPAAGGRFRAARSRIPARGARPSPARLCAGDGDAMARRRRPRRRARSRRCRPGPTARSRSRSGSRAIRASCSPRRQTREVA